MIIIIIRHKKTRNHPQYVPLCPTSAPALNVLAIILPFPNGIFTDWGMPYISPFDGEAYDQPYQPWDLLGLPCLCFQTSTNSSNHRVALRAMDLTKGRWLWLWSSRFMACDSALTGPTTTKLPDWLSNGRKKRCFNLHEMVSAPVFHTEPLAAMGSVGRSAVRIFRGFNHPLSQLGALSVTIPKRNFWRAGFPLLIHLHIYIHLIYIYVCYVLYIVSISIYIYPRIGMANAARNHKKSLYLVGKNVACDFPSKKCNNIMNPVINPNISQHLRHDIGGKKTGHGWWRYKDFNRPDPNNHKFSIKDYKGIWHV